MNQGKSPTWFYYAGTLLDAHKFDYVMKMDTDSLLYLDRYFNFAKNSLPPAPYNTRILASAPEHRLWHEMIVRYNTEHEPYFNSSLHLNVARNVYIVSHDLVDSITNVASNDNSIVSFAKKNKISDVSIMAFQALILGEKDNPIRYTIIQSSDPFWKHPLTLQDGVSKWKQTWDTETVRMRNLTMNKVASHPRSIATVPLARDRGTSTLSDIPIIELSQRSAWISITEQKETECLTDHLKTLDAVQINNSIAPTKSCFLNTGYLQRPLQVVQLTEPYEGGKHWGKLLTFFVQRFPTGADVIILNGIDVGMARSGNIHIVQKLAKALQMNYAWAVSEVQLMSSTPANLHGYSGPAILSKCPMHDPYLVRELHNLDSISKTKAILSNYGMFVRIASTETIASGVGNHIVVGSVSKLDQWKNRRMIWEYQFGYWPLDFKTGISPPNQIGSIIGGEMVAGTDTCSQFGLKQIEPSHTSTTFPANCRSAQYGTVRVDNICSNLVLAPQNQTGKAFKLYLPCIQTKQAGKVSEVQLSQHSIVFSAFS
jgi:hypothetical protein